MNDHEYKPDIKDFLDDGYGTYIHSNGDRYVGEFNNYKKCGQGISRYLSGDKYEGSFKNDTRKVSQDPRII